MALELPFIEIEKFEILKKQKPPGHSFVLSITVILELFHQIIMCFYFHSLVLQSTMSPYSTFKETSTNSNKAEFIIEKITVGDHCYFPLRPEMIEKGMAFVIKFNYIENLSDSIVVMHIIDANHQNRMYKLVLEYNKVAQLIEI